MTVDTPPGAGQYPTAPPWAPQPAPTAVERAEPLYGGLVPAYGDPENRHGQLLVRYPGEVSGRPEAPSWRPVVVLTFFFSMVGAVSALRRAGKAKRYGRARAPYWVAFGTTFVLALGFWTALTALVAIPAYLDHREQAITTVVQGGILDDGRIEHELAAEVTDARCMPEGERDSEGMRTYLCTFKLAEGGRAPVFVRADERGNWELRD